jgi:Carbohydrate binding domain (family 11).
VQLPEPNAPTTNTELVDDFEDGDYNPLWNSGPYWIETDVIGGGGASMAELSIVKGNNSSHALQMTYSLDVGEYPWGPPYATISTNDFMDQNLSQCSEVRYDYKGAAHSFRVKVSETMNNLLDMGWGFPTFVVGDSSASWQTVTIPVASLRQQWTGSSGNWVDIETVLPYVNGFDWRIDGKDVDDESSGTLAIDNIRCIGLAENPVLHYNIQEWR